MKRAILSSALIAFLIIVVVGFKQQAQLVVAHERYGESHASVPPTIQQEADFDGAAQATFKRTELLRGDLSISGREVVQALAEIPAGVESGRHTHPGEEVGYILEGNVVIEVEGKPPLTLKAGDVVLIPAGRIHNARNIGTETCKALSTYIIEKGKPLATKVP